MKYPLRYLLLCCMLFAGSALRAQSFTVVHDTIHISTTGLSNAVDSVLNTTSSPINMDWKVIATDFPMCWQENTGICEPAHCFQMSVDLWPTTTHNAVYIPGYDLITCNTDLTTCTPGCYYLTVRLNNAAIPTDTAYITFMVCKPAPAKTTTAAMAKEIVLYPNPATGVLHITFGAFTGIEQVVMYNIIGRQMGAYRAVGNGTTINTEPLPAGVYFVRLLNEQGHVAGAQRFTKQ